MFPPKQSFAQRNQQVARPNGAQQMQVMGGQNQLQDNQPLNPDIPMGNPVDTIAQMLGLDLTNAVSQDQQGQIVVQAVEQLVLKLHELTGAPDDDGQQVDDQDNDQFADDETGNPDGPTDDEQTEEGQDEETEAPQEQPPSPQPNQKKKGFAAAFDTAPSKKALSLAADGRKMKIQHLAIQGYITPIIAKELTLEYCSVGAVSLALSLDSDTPDDFDRVCNVLQRNGKVVRFGEVSGAQTELSYMNASDGKLYSLSQDELQDEKKNPLLANAVSRSKR